MCIKWFKKKPEIPQPPVLVLPHPEEAEDKTATLGNTNIRDVLTSWMIKYKVPPYSYSYFYALDIQLDVNAGFAYTMGKAIRVNPKWANTGVMAHEIAHVVRAELSNTQTEEFAFYYKDLLQTNELLQLLQRQHGYMDTNEIEAHAEIYRYLGQEMPPLLRQYYPRLF